MLKTAKTSTAYPTLATEKWYGSKDWADYELKGLLSLLSDNTTWNLPHNWYSKRLVAELIIERLEEAGFGWHFKVASGHFHRWLKRKSWTVGI